MTDPIHQQLPNIFVKDNTQVEWKATRPDENPHVSLTVVVRNDTLSPDTMEQIKAFTRAEEFKALDVACADLRALQERYEIVQADRDRLVQQHENSVKPPNPFDYVIGQLFCEHGDVDVFAEAHVGDEVLEGCMRFFKGTGDRLNFRFEVEPTEADRACAAAEEVPVQVAVARRRAHAQQRGRHRIEDLAFAFVMGQAQKEALPRQAAGHEVQGIGPDLRGMPDRMGDLDLLEDA